MPDKRYVKGCGPGCLRCWQNRLKHGNPQAKAYVAKNPQLFNDIAIWEVNGERKEVKGKYRYRNRCKKNEQVQARYLTEGQAIREAKKNIHKDFATDSEKVDKEIIQEAVRKAMNETRKQQRYERLEKRRASKENESINI